jgi:hypothetical protein
VAGAGGAAAALIGGGHCSGDALCISLWSVFMVIVVVSFSWAIWKA